MRLLLVLQSSLLYLGVDYFKEYFCNADGWIKITTNSTHGALINKLMGELAVNETLVSKIRYR